MFLYRILGFIKIKMVKLLFIYRNKWSSKTGPGIGMGNGQKKSKAFEEFVFTKRQFLKHNLKLCERAAQKVLVYSNNFLHKKLITEQVMLYLIFS